MILTKYVNDTQIATLI